MSKIIKHSEQVSIRAERLDFVDLAKKGEAILAEARRRAEEVLKESKKLEAEANLKLNEAHKKESEAKNILSDAEKARVELEQSSKEKGFKEGHDKGFEAGHAEGLEKGESEAFKKAYEDAFKEKQAFVEQESAPVLETLAAMLEEFEATLEKTRVAARGEVVNLAIAIAEKIIRREINIDPTIVMDSVRKAIDLSLQKHSVRAKVNMDDLELVNRYLPTLKSLFSRVESIELIEDENVTSGGCIVESGSGSVDMRIETQLASIERELLNREASNETP